MPNVCARCPHCGSTEVRRTLRTISGSYCRCVQCDHAWHDDADEATLPVDAFTIDPPAPLGSAE